MALSQFMPYGASELLADQEQRMARASAVATALFVLIFLGMLVLLPRIPVAANAPAEFPAETHWIEPPPSDEPLVAVAPVQPLAQPQAAETIPMPVPDALAPETPAAPLNPGATQGTIEGSGEPEPGGGGETGNGIAPERDPVWGVYEPVDQLPVLVSSPGAAYSDFARDAGIEGRVVVRVLVGKDGRVKEAIVDPKFSVPMLNAIALEAARGSVFTPALSNGHPVAVWVARPYEFRLH